jgi:8-hydroxy-5-deazaflavin:NADPH oxidoreductase
VLAVKGTVAVDALRAAGAANLGGKSVIDATNPISDLPPVNGVLRFFTNLDESLMERLQREFQSAHFVKAFNSVGNACMVNPQFKGGKPSMFICGNDDAAKKVVTGVLDQFGWETTWAKQRQPVPLSLSVCFGAFPAFSVTTGSMRSRCWLIDWGGVSADGA